MEKKALIKLLTNIPHVVELQTDLDINLYDYGARNYDPAIGRWLIPDPLFNDLRTSIDFNQVRGDEIDMLEAIANKMEVGNGVFNTNNLNLYSYGYNNPIGFNDPDGRCPMCIGAGLGFLGSAGLELGGQLLSGKSLKQVDWADVLIEGVKGGVYGTGVGASYAPAIESVSTLLKASVDVSSEGGTQIITNGSKSLSSAAFDATADVVLGKMGTAGSKSLNKMADNFVSSASKTEVKTAKSLTKANNVFNKVTDGGKNMMGSKSVAATSNLVNAQSNMLKAKGHTTAAKLFQTSTKNGTVINNAIQNKTTDKVKEVFGL